MKETALWILFFINYIFNLIFAYVNAVSINAKKLYMYDLKANDESLFIKNDTPFSGSIFPDISKKAKEKYHKCTDSEIFPLYAFTITIFMLVTGLLFRNNIRVLVTIGLIFFRDISFIILFLLFY